METIKYPIGIQTFADVINGGYKYVDKTEYVWRLVTQGKYYFLSRPRRFGKSLFLSTIEAFFRGRRDLFKGLFIERKDWNWEEYPVFHLALNGQDYDSVERLDETLHNNMSIWEKQYGLSTGNQAVSVSTRFFNCIFNAYQASGKGVVVLIDEYDQPFLQNLEQGREELYETIRERLQAFFSVLKAQDQYVKFAILTGISRFGKVSVFSGLNNLNDISLDNDVNAICGISECELHDKFADGIELLASANDMPYHRAAERLKREYDGYRFSKKGEGVYNPFSLLNAFAKKEFGHYWISTGTPSFLIRLLEKHNWDLSKIAGSTVSEAEITGSDIYLTNPIPMLFQSGYLTIKDYDTEFKEYKLGYPNEEVVEGFRNWRFFQ